MQKGYQQETMLPKVVCGDDVLYVNTLEQRKVRVVSVEQDFRKMIHLEN